MCLEAATLLTAHTLPYAMGIPSSGDFLLLCLNITVWKQVLACLKIACDIKILVCGRVKEKDLRDFIVLPLNFCCPTDFFSIVLPFVKLSCLYPLQRPRV